MISLPFRRLRRDPTIDTLYGTIVAQARSPVFYRDYGVPDTVLARLDMIMLHLVLVLRRLRDAGPDGPAVGQRLFDHFCRDIDDNFREMGVGDLAVPKEMRRVAVAFYGRAKAYEAALAAPAPAALAGALARNIHDAEEAPLGARRLAAYMMTAAAELSALDAGALLEGRLAFPDPDATPPAEQSQEATP
jgi:cytochrome b pre-mRNA-processing protein 3